LYCDIIIVVVTNATIPNSSRKNAVVRSHADADDGSMTVLLLEDGE
jgi:hypothetical protein